MSHQFKDNPFGEEFEDENAGDGLLSKKDLAETLSTDKSEYSEEFDSSFSVPKFDTKSKKYDNNLIEAEDLEDTNKTIEVSRLSDTQGKAEVYINRRKNGELDSIEVIASNGERILIHFETDENIPTEE